MAVMGKTSFKLKIFPDQNASQLLLDIQKWMVLQFNGKILMVDDIFWSYFLLCSRKYREERRKSIYN